MTEPDALLLVYVPVPDEAAGLALAESAVRAKLAACGNILPGVTSVYEWEGVLETANEAVLILKTTPELADALEAHVQASHPYDCPCILRLPPAQANTPYAAWVRQQIGKG
jgi:periplasmic divalent cation tolerance protein